MDERTLTALKGSIAKWEGIVAGTAENQGPNNCPLCQLFHWEKGGSHSLEPCDGCPVKDETGQSGCGGSPYDDYEYMAEGNDSDNYETLEAAAQAELDFLRSLLPDETHETVSHHTSRPSPRGTE